MPTQDPLPTRRAEFRLSQPIEIRFNDYDLLGHVNNALYLTYCESGRFAYLTAAVPDLSESEFNLILAHASIDYRRPVRWGDTVQICARTITIGTKSFTMEYLILGRDAEGEYLAAEARSVQVNYDYSSGQSIPLPSAAIRALEAFEGRPLRG